MQIRPASVGASLSNIYDIVAQIPTGKVATYSQIAEMLGWSNRARIVGWAMRHAPSHLHLPCHRVISASGRLSPDHVFGGPDIQRAMLEAEGVEFLPNGRVDMAEYLW